MLFFSKKCSDDVKKRWLNALQSDILTQFYFNDHLRVKASDRVIMRFNQPRDIKTLMNFEAYACNLTCELKMYLELHFILDWESRSRKRYRLR